MISSVTLPLPIVVALSTAAIYVFVLGLLRLFGRRHLGQLTAIDLVVMLTLGSAVETSMIHGSTSLASGLISASTLLALNAVIDRLLIRSDRARHFVNGGPKVLVRSGRVIESQLRRSGFTDADLKAALRGRGFAGPAKVDYAVLEVDGSVTVIPST